MPIPGPTVHRLLTDAYNQHHAAYERDRAAMMGVKTQREALDAGRSDALVDLATFYLPELTPDAISGTWAEVRGRITVVLDKQHRHIDRLARELEDLSRSRRRDEDELNRITESLDEALDRRGELTVRLEKELEADAEFGRLATRAAQAEAALERAEANLTEIEQDAARKLPAYESNRLFTYLRDRNFGTPQYKHRGFTRRMDRSLAKFVGFNQSVQSYEFLKATPDRMRKIIADDRAALDTVMDELERRRDATSESLGLNLVIDRVENLQQQRGEIVARLDQTLTDIDAKQREVTDAQDTRGPYYRDAIGIFREMLSGFDTEDLRRRARRTVDVTDDQIVARLEGVEDRIEDLDEQTRRKHDLMVRRQQMLTQLGQLIQRFRAAGFDSGRSQFADAFDIAGSVNAAMGSASDRHWGDAIESLWNQIRSAQMWGPSVGEQLTNVATHPMTQVLINAAAHVAGGVLESKMRNAGHRRYGHRRRGNWGRGGPWGGRGW